MVASRDSIAETRVRTVDMASGLERSQVLDRSSTPRMRPPGERIGAE